MPATSITETNTAVVAATLVHRSPMIVDAVTKQLALWFWLKTKGRYKPKTGRVLEWPVFYKLKGGKASYQGFDIWALKEQDDATLARANWKYYHESIVWSGADTEVLNTGPEQVFDLYQQKEDSAIANLQTIFNTDFYADGTGNSSKDVTGLGAIIPQDPTTGTIYGFNRATAGNEFMRSMLVDSGSSGTGVAPYSGSPTVYTMLLAMAKLYQYCGRLRFGKASQRFPDLILCSEGYQRSYESCLQPNQRFTNTQVADAGFTNLTYKKTTIIDDQDCPIDTVNAASGGKSPQTGIFINSNFIELGYAKNRDMKVTKPVMSPNQDAFVAHILWAGELLATLLPKHGRHIGILEP